MRILMLAQFYPPTVGGEEQHVRTLSVALAERGHDVAVATLWCQGLARFEIDRGVRVYRIHGTAQRAAWLFSEAERRHMPPFPDPEAVWALRRIIARERPEIVHAHNWIVHSFLPLKTWSRAKLIVTLHDYSLVCAKKRLMYQDAPCAGPAALKCLNCTTDHYGWARGVPTVLGNWAMGMAERAYVDMFFTVSYATAAGNDLVAHDLPFQVIPNFVPDDLGAPRDVSDPRLAQLPDDDFLLFVGDITRDKGVDALLHAYANLTNAPPLVLIGRRCADTAAELPRDVLMLGSWPHDTVMEAWRRSSIALVPSIVPETFGIVAIEAMAMGKPVIASRIGGLPELVDDGTTGLLVAPGDPMALQIAIARLLATPALLEQMGHAARQKVSAFRASTVVPRVEEAYREVIQGGARHERTRKGVGAIQS